jgi:LruC domain-containing protein
MNYKIFIFVLLAAFSCIRIPDIGDFESPLVVPKDFDWKTTENQTVNIPAVSTILNQYGDTIATSMPAGSHQIFTSKNTVLSIITESTSSYPATKAVNKGVIKEVFYFPAKNKYATIMMEDLFPYRGDMDMNDIVFGLNLELYLDNQARVRAFSMKIEPRAIGSSYRDIALAASLYSPNLERYVDQITHSANPDFQGFFEGVTIDNKNSYGVETSTRFDVIPITGNFRRYFENATELFLNVREEDPFLDTEPFEVFVELKSNMIFPISAFTFLSPLSEGKINLDLFGIFGQRGREVHFKGGQPSDFFYLPFLISSGKPDFSTPDNWVWAIMSTQSIRHPLEFKKIYNAYPNFKLWAESGGNQSIDWHTPAISDSLYNKGNFNYIN